jgi:hypothetical protein
MNADKNFGVYHKADGNYFVGFDADSKPVWGKKIDAKRMTKLEATAQSSLFVANNLRVQRKPVDLTECDHAWILNVKPAVCLYCRARRGR